MSGRSAQPHAPHGWHVWQIDGFLGFLEDQMEVHGSVRVRASYLSQVHLAHWERDLSHWCFPWKAHHFTCLPLWCAQDSLESLFAAIRQNAGGGRDVTLAKVMYACRPAEMQRATLRRTTEARKKAANSGVNDEAPTTNRCASHVAHTASSSRAKSHHIIMWGIYA